MAISPPCVVVVDVRVDDEEAAVRIGIVGQHPTVGPPHERRVVEHDIAVIVDHGRAYPPEFERRRRILVSSGRACHCGMVKYS